jgi:hypothetical protein
LHQNIVAFSGSGTLYVDVRRQDFGLCNSLLGAYWPNGRPRFAHEDHPQFVADWPFVRPAWWLPPPGMMAAIEAEPEYRPYNYQEPDWRQWVPRYVVGQHWPWRGDEAQAEAEVPEEGKAPGDERQEELEGCGAQQTILAAQDRAAGLPAWPRTACRAWSAGSGRAAVASRPRSQRLTLGQGRV